MESPETAPEPPSPENQGDAEAPESPYKSLWVPLLVVPAAIAMAFAVVVAFFGAIAGEEKSPLENLDTMLTGGANEREQAAFNLVRQAQENWEARANERDPEWDLEGEFQNRLRGAWESLHPEDHQFRFVVANLQAQLGKPEGVSRLIEILGIPDAADPVGTDNIRSKALLVLGVLGPDLDPELAEEARQAIVPFLQHPDHVYPIYAAGALQHYPGEATREALRGLLRGGELALRSSAAISLSHLGDPAGAEALMEAIDPTSYELERQLDSAKWARGTTVRHARVRSVLALARLRRPQDRAYLQELADDEPDLEVRQAARRALDDWESRAE